ncbi:MAG: ABC transporter ATP-binding protein [Bacteroidetes bacterium]|nr:ABC transporter ATP-binding protein [Bacteroidota bacterium]
MIEAKNICKTFGKLKVLDDVSITLQSHDAVAIIGPNASGKTTFIKSLLGLVKPERGTIHINNQSILHSWQYRSQIGYMPQIGRYPENMTIQQVVEMIMDLRQCNASNIDNDLVNAYNLKEIYNKRTGTLSGGTRQKLSACICFLFSPSIIILDEPTAGLDPVSSEILKEKIIHEKNKGKLIMITSHLLSELDDLVGGIVYFKDGKIVFHKTLLEIMSATGEEKVAKALTSYIRQN